VYVKKKENEMIEIKGFIELSEVESSNVEGGLGVLAGAAVVTAIAGAGALAYTVGKAAGKLIARAAQGTLWGQ